MKTTTTFDTVSTIALDAVTGGTTGPESGARDPGNDKRYVCFRLHGAKACIPIDSTTEK